MRLPAGDGEAIANPKPATARKVGGNTFDENPSGTDPDAQSQGFCARSRLVDCDYSDNYEVIVIVPGLRGNGKQVTDGKQE
jgi:hypothetical protein